MKRFIIKGPNKAIKGEVNISGAKNAALPLMAASILFKKKVILKMLLKKWITKKLSRVTLSHWSG